MISTCPGLRCPACWTAWTGSACPCAEAPRWWPAARRSPSSSPRPADLWSPPLGSWNRHTGRLRYRNVLNAKDIKLLLYGNRKSSTKETVLIGQAAGAVWSWILLSVTVISRMTTSRVIFNGGQWPHAICKKRFAYEFGPVKTWVASPPHASLSGVKSFLLIKLN